jgi:hypothetical protein
VKASAREDPILWEVFSAAARRLAFYNILRELMHGHQELLGRGVVWQECNVAAVADAEEPYSFFTCKITC